MEDPTQLPPLELPRGITSRFVDTSPRGLKFHVLESVPPSLASGTRPPLILLVHGFPNLAYDWRFVMPRLSEAGYYAVAFDQRGFGRTHSADLQPFDPASFRPLTLVRDVVALVHALGYDYIHTLVGHDMGAATSSYCCLAREDMIKSLALMCHPFAGPPKIPFGNSASNLLPAAAPPSKVAEIPKDPDVHTSLLALNPPRKHYKWYNISANAASEWSYPTGEPMHEFLRGYFHLKSAAATGDLPRPLTAWNAHELSVMPHYYVMRAEHTVRENVRLDMEEEPKDVVKDLGSTSWLPDKELAVYTAEWSRTTFTSALRWYAVLTNPDEMEIFASKKISIPTKYISGIKDWGNYQVPGSLAAMEKGQSVRADRYQGTVLTEGAGHWVHMEKPEICVNEILKLASSV
jgi:pimeloyl-ACP methyl ester carboxylesterase